MFTSVLLVNHLKQTFSKIYFFLSWYFIKILL
uniref:Uncharacterized protein n=1 Tax=Anguilla anguilla TaxID=7936 RepID=A0A0E9UM40_ANGAN